MSETVHVSSLLVSAKPDFLAQVTMDIERIEIADIAHAGDNGKVIVTLETENESQIVQALTDIQLIEGVVSAALVFHQVDEFSSDVTPDVAE